MPEGDIYIGLMSGTSMDAVDTVLAQFSEDQPTILAYEQFPIDAGIKTEVRKIDGTTSLEKTTKYDSILGHLFADSVLKILDLSGVKYTQVKAVGSHGQTVLHLPERPCPRTLQIGDPNIIAQRTGITTVADFRRMDIASGGQGAPLAPAFHETSFRVPGIDRIILNLGGIANITLLPGDTTLDISGFDTGPGNGLLDDWNQLHNNTEMDRDSAWAASGNTHPDLLESFLSDAYFQLRIPKSTGRDDFNLGWVNLHLSKLNSKLSPEDVQATLLRLTIENIAQAIEQHAPQTSELYACGGGAHNKRLMQGLKERLSITTVTDTNALGLNPDAIEAITFAWLAKQRLETRVGSLPSVTGANSAQILGGIYQPSTDQR